MWSPGQHLSLGLKELKTSQRIPTRAKANANHLLLSKDQDLRVRLLSSGVCSGKASILRADQVIGQRPEGWNCGSTLSLPHPLSLGASSF